ncbi:MAG: AMP-dependent synthetase/ligase [Candidatus Polarisedimenticolia bacterium]
MNVRTLCDIPRRLAADLPRPDQILYREGGVWRPIGTDVFVRRIRDLALGFLRLGAARGDRIALLAENRPEWPASDYAILAFGAVTTPIYPSLLPDQIAFILADAGARIAVVSTTDQMRKILAVRDRLPDLKTLVVMDSDGSLPEGAVGWHDVAELGAAQQDADFEREAAATRPEDLATVVYTSGTTGQPKGVMLTHANLVSNVVASCEAIPFRRDDICLSFLPLCHIYERVVEFCYLYQGASIAYAASMDAVPENLLELRPTFLCGVPRFFEKVHRRAIEAGASLPPPRRQLFRWAMDVARRYGAAVRPGRGAPPHLAIQRAVADRLVFRKLRARLGGRMRIMISGGAPLQRDIAQTLYGAGLQVLEGYGMTETGTVVAVNRPEAFRFGTVGPLIPGAEVRVAGDGEILVRSPSVMKGYWNNETATREALQGGWLRTGDIGRLDPDGFLVITDRKKEVLKTSGGKMVAPQPIENRLRSDRYIAQAVLIGDRRRFIAALIVPALEELERYAREAGLGVTGPGDLIRHPAIAALIEGRIGALNEGLARYEQIKKFRLLDRELSPDRGELTPTLKLVRRVIEANHRDRIEEMYAEDEPRAAAGGSVR